MNDVKLTTTDPDAALSHQTYVIEAWLLAFLALGMLLIAWSQGWGFWQLPVLIALGLYAAGVFGGFLFGIPKVSARQSGSDTVDRAQQLLDPNTNLEQISDWLTKIIVGLGLVELKSTWPALLQFAKEVAPAFHSWSQVAPLSATFYFPVLGFGSGFLFTRLYLSGLIGRADRQLESQRRTPEAKNAAASVQRSLVEAVKEGPNKQAPANLTPDEVDALRVTDKLLRSKPESKYTWKDWMDRAYAAYAEHRLAPAANYFGEAARASGASAEERGKAYLNQGVTFDQLGLAKEAIACYDIVISRLQAINDPAINVLVASAMYSKAQLLSRDNQLEQSRIAYDDLISRFQSDPDPKISGFVTSGILNRGVSFGKLGSLPDALSNFDLAIKRLEGSTKARDQMTLVLALADKGETLGRLGNYQEALKVLDAAIEQFKNATDDGVKNRLAFVEFNRAVTLKSIDEVQAAAALEQLIAAQSQNAYPTVRTIVSKAQAYLSEATGPWQYIDVTWQ